MNGPVSHSVVTECGGGDVRNINELVDVVFSGLPPLVIEDVADEGERILVRARTEASP